MATITNCTQVIYPPEYEQAWEKYTTIYKQMSEASSKVKDAYARGVGVNDPEVLALTREYKQLCEDGREAMNVIKVMLENITPKTPSSNG